jgi:putative ABC transport system permease protein
LIRLLLSSFAAHLRSGRVLFLLTLLGVALGVASVLSIQILSDSALGAFEGSVRAVGGDADLTVSARGPALPDSVVPRVLGTQGVAAAWPVMRMEVAVAGKEAFFLELVGLDLFAPRRIPWSAPPREVSDALGEPGWVAVTPALARSLGWKIGTSFEVTSGSREIRLKVGALVDFQKISPLASSRLVVMDIAQAQSLLGRKGELDEVEVRVEPGTDAKAVAGRLRDRLAGEAKVATPEQRREEAEGLMGAFRLNLTALSLISLFVGTFLVYTSTRASLIRRRTELGILRSLGATPSQVLGLLLFEVTILALLGVLPGIALGDAVARANLKSVSATLSNLYLLEEVETIRASPGAVALAGLLGIAGALAGALAPSWESSRREIRGLLFQHTLHERADRTAVRLFLAGLVLLAGAGIWYALVGRHARPGGFVLGFTVVLTLPLLSPLVLGGLARLVRVRSLALAYGVRSLAQRLGITAVSAAALAVSVSMLVGITFMIGSFRRTLEVWIATTVRADVYVSSESYSRARGEAGLDPEILAALASRGEVRSMDRLRQTFTECEGRRVSVIGVDMALAGGISRFAMLEGDAGATLRAAREGAILVGEPLARKAGLKTGDLLRMATPAGERALRIAGIYYDYGSEQGSAAMDLSTFARLFGDGPINNAALYLRPGVDPERLADALRAALPNKGLRIRSNRQLRERIFSIFDQTFAVTRLLQGMSLLVAVCGITLTLLVIARERVWEIALYRALGAQRAQIVKVFLGKGLGLAAAGIVLGLPGGTALALILVFVINRSYFGWTLALHWPLAALSGQLALLLAAAAAASVYPAWLASRTPAAELSRDEG